LFGVSGKAEGYTILEVMIFLAVTAGLFVMIAGTFSRRQATTEFSIAVRDMESRLQDIANDVSTGYYSNPGTFRCRIIGAAPDIVAGTNTQGTNNDCIFVGRVAQFDLAGSSGKQFNLYSVVGARQASGEDVENFDEAQPRALANPVSPVDLTEGLSVPVGLVIRSMYAVGTRTNPTLRYPIRAAGFFSSFGAGSSDPTSLTVNVMPIGGLASGNPPVSNSKADVVSAVSRVNNARATEYANPPGGIMVCMDGDNTNQHVLLKLGGNARQLATDSTIEEGTCASAGY